MTRGTELPREHGTKRGYEQHHYRGEPACAACLDGRAAERTDYQLGHRFRDLADSIETLSLPARAAEPEPIDHDRPTINGRQARDWEVDAVQRAYANALDRDLQTLSGITYNRQL